MIDVKLIKKPKEGRTTGSVRHTGTPGAGGEAEEAKHAARADKSDYAEQADYANRSGYASRAAYAEKANDLSEGSPLYDRFLRKDAADTAQKLIRFLEGIALGSEEGRYYLDANGFARLFRIVASSITSSRYAAGDEGLGFSLYEDEDGTGNLVIDNLKVRKKMSVAELEVRKKTYTSGNLSIGKAGNTIFAVRPYRHDGTPIGDMAFSVGGEVIAVQAGSVEVLGEQTENEPPAYYRCYFLRTDGERTVDNCWQACDQAKCQTDNLVEGTTMNAANRYYWRLVVGKGTETLEDGREYHYVDLSNEEHVEVGGKTCTGYDTSAENDAPMTGDDIAQEGNQTDKTRQGLIVIDSEEGISKYSGIDSFSYEGKRKQHIGDTVEMEVNRLSIISEAPDGTPEEYRVPCDMGAWTARAYPYYTRVSKDGSLWLCLNPAGATAADVPSDGSSVWEKQVSKGDRGAEPVMLSIITDKGNIIRNGQGQITLTAVVTQGGEDITEKFRAEDFSWLRYSGNDEYDTAWNNRHAHIGKTITVTAEDIWKKAQFECVLHDN
jgi:hypothetical protein